jgi:CHAT domain-containing protein
MKQLNRLLILFLFFVDPTVASAFQSSCAQKWHYSLDSLQDSFEEEMPANLPFHIMLKKAEDCFMESFDSLGIFKSAMLTIDYYNRAGKIDESLKKISAIQLEKNIPWIASKNPSLVADLYYVWAYSLQEIGLLDTAIEKMSEALFYFKRSNDFQGITDAYLSLAELSFRNNAKLADVKEFFRQAELSAKNHLKQEDPSLAHLYQTASLIFFEEGDNPKAIEYAEKGLNLALNKKNKDIEQIGAWYKFLSNLYGEDMDNNQALIYALAAIPYMEKMQKPYLLIDLYGNICELYILLGKKKESLEYFEKCRNLTLKTGWHPAAEKASGLYSYRSLGVCMLKLKQADSIIAFVSPLIPDIEKYNLKPDEAYKLLGRAYELKADYQKAEFYLQKTLAISRKKFGNNGKRLAHNYYFLSDIYAKNKDWDKCLSTLDTLFRLLALPSSNREMVNFEHVLGHRTLTYAFEQRGKAYSAKEMFLEAHQDYELAISLLHYMKENYASEASKHFTLETLRPLYEAAGQAALQLHKSGDKNALSKDFQNLIFEYAEQSKATLLNESIIKFRSHFNRSAGIPDSLVNYEEQLINTIEKHREYLYGAQQKNDSVKVRFWQAKILEEQRKLESFEQELDKNYPNYKTDKEKELQIASIDKIREKLDEKTLLIEYFISEQSCFIFFITKDSSDIIIIEDHSLLEFRSLIRELRNTLSNPTYITDKRKEGYDLFTKSAFSLFDKYVKHSFLSDKHNLIIVPDRELNYIPFEVLLVEKAGVTNALSYDSLAYLIKSYNIRYEYSATVMVNHNHEKKAQGNGRILGYAPIYEQDIDFETLNAAQRAERTPKEVHTHKNLKNLSGARKELQMIQAWADGDFYFGSSATEGNFKLNVKDNYSVVHLASHGVVDLDHPSYSSLVYTEDLDSLQDNLLYAYEINHLDMRNIELVVLSACETGYGKYALGEGMVSLGRSFMYAGVSSIVSTLWELNDQSSVEIMKIFYRNLSNGMRKDEALRAAKLDFLKKNQGISAHPFFWAGIIQIGDPSPIKLHYNRGLQFLGLVFIAIIFCSIIGIWLILRKQKHKKQNSAT